MCKYYRLFFLFMLINKIILSFRKHHLNDFTKLYSKKYNIENQYIRNIKNKHAFGESEAAKFLDENEFIKDKKLMSISPGGFKGFYMMGICKFIKKNYNLDNYIFSGASAGAWNSLLLCFNRDIDEIQYKILDTTLQNTNKINDIEKRIKYKMLDNYNSNDFDLRRLFIGVTTFDSYIYKANTTIFTGFDSLEDALNCCIASSHIPLVTGGFTNVYRNVLSFDGGFSRYPYLNTSRSVLHVTPNIWKKENKSKSTTQTMSISDYTTLFSKAQYNFNNMVEKGYTDSLENKKLLDGVLI